MADQTVVGSSTALIEELRMLIEGSNKNTLRGSNGGRVLSLLDLSGRRSTTTTKGRIVAAQTSSGARRLGRLRTGNIVVGARSNASVERFGFGGRSSRSVVLLSSQERVRLRKIQSMVVVLGAAWELGLLGAGNFLSGLARV